VGCISGMLRLYGADSRGDVGCGKTMLMDMLYDTLPASTHKLRVHFHAFMLDMHKLPTPGMPLIVDNRILRKCRIHRLIRYLS
jgi:hypothetical protein